MRTKHKPKSNPESPAALVRRMRTKLGMTQTEFAARCGVSLNTVSNAERGIAITPQTALGIIALMSESGVRVELHHLVPWLIGNDSP